MICPRPQSLGSSPPNFLNASSAFPPPRSVAILHWRKGILSSLFPKTWPNPLWWEVCACPNSLQGSHFSRTLTITRPFSIIYNDNVIIIGTETGTQNSWVGAKAAPGALWTTQHPIPAGSSPAWGPSPAPRGDDLAPSLRWCLKWMGPIQVFRKFNYSSTCLFCKPNLPRSTYMELIIAW